MSAKEKSIQAEAGGEISEAARPRRKGRSRDGSAATRREEILDAAARLFARNGFEATSVRQIAKEVDILSGSLYHHFATKEEMLHEILRNAEPMSRKTSGISRLEADAEQKLAALIMFRFREFTRDHKTFGIIYNNRNFFRGRAEFSYVERIKTEGFEAVAAVLQEGVDKGLFKPGLDVYLTIGTIFRLLSGAADWFVSGSFVQIDREPEAYTIDGVIDYHLDFILSAIRAPERIAEPVPRGAAERLLQLV